MVQRLDGRGVEARAVAPSETVPDADQCLSLSLGRVGQQRWGRDLDWQRSFANAE